MECNKDEAKRALDIAEKKLSENDYIGGKKFVNKARNMYPNLDGLKQVSVMIDVYMSASNNITGEREADWYGVLGADPLADDETLKKQYKKLALLLHPDKNKYKGAEGAFKLVLEAWCLLSDKVSRTAHDESRTLNAGMQKPPPNQHKPDSSNGNQNAKDRVDLSAGVGCKKSTSGAQKPPYAHKPSSSDSNQNARDGVDDPSANTINNKHVPAPAPTNKPKQRKYRIFWAMCIGGCKTRTS